MIKLKKNILDIFSFYIITLLYILSIITLFYSIYCAFTWFKFTYTDYGIYTNAIWNCSNLNFFKYLIKENYLNRHLSFSLAFLGLFFKIWDNAFLLSLIQFLLTIIGSFILFTVMNKYYSKFLSISVSLLYVIHPFTQSSLLCEFHGITLTLFLIPLLYYTLKFKRQYVWVPFLLLLGLREDIGLLTAPIYLYFARKYKWKKGYIYSIASFLYSFFAIAVLFPLITGNPIHKVRPAFKNIRAFTSKWTSKLIYARLKALWLIIPIALCTLGKKIRPIIYFSIMPFLANFFSPYIGQLSFHYHYPSLFLACFSIGITEMLIINKDDFIKNKYKEYAITLFIILFALIYNYHDGFILKTRNHFVVYEKINFDGLAAIDCANHIPKQGILITDRMFGGICANRKDLIIWQYYNDYKDKIKYVLLKIGFWKKHRKEYLELLNKYHFGLYYLKGNYAVLKKNYNYKNNNFLLNLVGEKNKKSS